MWNDNNPVDLRCWIFWPGFKFNQMNAVRPADCNADTMRNVQRGSLPFLIKADFDYFYNNYDHFCDNADYIQDEESTTDLSAMTEISSQTDVTIDYDLTTLPDLNSQSASDSTTIFNGVTTSVLEEFMTDSVTDIDGESTSDATTFNVVSTETDYDLDVTTDEVTYTTTANAIP